MRSRREEGDKKCNHVTSQIATSPVDGQGIVDDVKEARLPKVFSKNDKLGKTIGQVAWRSIRDSRTMGSHTHLGRSGDTTGRVQVWKLGTRPSDHHR